MQEAQRKEIEREISRLLSRTRYGVYNNLMHTFATAIDILLNWNESTMNTVATVAAGRIMKVPYAMKDGAKKFTLHIKSASLIYEQTFMKDTETDLTPEQQDAVRQDANEFLRLNLGFIDRCTYNADNAKKIFDFISSLPSDNIIPIEEINQFIAK